MATILRFDEITDIRDARILAWLDIYEASFPWTEKVPISAHIRDLYEPPSVPDDYPRHRFVALDDVTGDVVGMARYSFHANAGAVYLMYLAVSPDVRGGGVGAAMLTEIVTRARTAYPNGDLLAWEVERPDKARSQRGREQAERRIQFYQRQGARLVRGSGHSDRLGEGFPRVLFDLMFLPFREVSDAEVAQSLRALFAFPASDDALTMDFVTQSAPSVAK